MGQKLCRLDLVTLLASRYTLPTVKRMIPLVVVVLSTAICAAQGAKTLVLEKNEGEARVRRPRGSLLTPNSRVHPESDSREQQLETTCAWHRRHSSRGVIPKPKHLEQDQILLAQTGTAHVTLDDKEYDVHAGGTVSSFRLRLG